MTKASVLCALVLATGTSLFADPLLTLDPPSGTITGTAGQIVGWGFVLENTSGFENLLVTTSYLINETNPSLGSYWDIISYEGGSAGGLTPPNAVWTQTFNYDPDPNLQTGVGYFMIDPSALVGDSDTATLVLQYELDNSITGQFDSSGFLTAPVAVEVVAPEPGMGWPLVAICGGWLAVTRRRRV